MSAKPSLLHQRIEKLAPGEVLEIKGRARTAAWALVRYVRNTTPHWHGRAFSCDGRIYAVRVS